MTSESYWKDLITEMLVELSPRSDVDDIVNRIDIEEYHGKNLCTARVNATTWIERQQRVGLDDQIVEVEPHESTGIGEQRITVQSRG